MGFKKIKSISCNRDICHAITESGQIYSWGIDIEEKGLLALGNNIFHVKIPTLNKYLSKLRVYYISLSETHGAALDYGKNLYTWGDDSFGQCGYNTNSNIENNNNENNNIENNNFENNNIENNNKDNNLNNDNYYYNNVCFIPKKVVLNANFNVSKVECGKYYTAGITSDGIAFKFGVINYKSKINVDNIKRNHSNIVFFNFKNNETFNYRFDDFNFDKVTNIFCGEELLIFITHKGELYIYSELQGLFKIKLNNDDNENEELNFLSEEAQNYLIDSVKFIDRTFYAISKNNSIIYEFINYTYKNKDIDLYDYTQNEYDVNENVKLSMITQPYYVKVLFFQMKCTEHYLKAFEEGDDKIFYKRKYNPESNDFLMTNTLNNFNNTYESVNSIHSNVNNLTTMSKISKISNMLGNILDKKIDNLINKTKIYYNSEGNAFLIGKKRIELIKVDFENYEGVNFLENEPISIIIGSTNNSFNLTSNILNIPINENYKNQRNRLIRNLFDDEKNRAFSSSKSNFSNRFNNKNKFNNYRYGQINNTDNDYNSQDQKLRGLSSHNINIDSDYNNIDQSEKIKEKMNKFRKNMNDKVEQRINDSNKNKENLMNNLKRIENNSQSPYKNENQILDKFKDQIKKENELNEKEKNLRDEMDKRNKEIINQVNQNKKNTYDNQFNNLKGSKRNSDQLNNFDSQNNSKRNSINNIKIEKGKNFYNIKTKGINDIESSTPERKNSNNLKEYNKTSNKNDEIDSENELKNNNNDIKNELNNNNINNDIKKDLNNNNNDIKNVLNNNNNNNENNNNNTNNNKINEEKNKEIPHFKLRSALKKPSNIKKVIDKSDESNEEEKLNQDKNKKLILKLDISNESDEDNNNNENNLNTHEYKSIKENNNINRNNEKDKMDLKIKEDENKNIKNNENEKLNINKKSNNNNNNDDKNENKNNYINQSNDLNNNINENEKGNKIKDKKDKTDNFKNENIQNKIEPNEKEKKNYNINEDHNTPHSKILKGILKHNDEIKNNQKNEDQIEKEEKDDNENNIKKKNKKKNNEKENINDSNKKFDNKQNKMNKEKNNDNINDNKFEENQETIKEKSGPNTPIEKNKINKNSNNQLSKDENNNELLDKNLSSTSKDNDETINLKYANNSNENITPKTQKKNQEKMSQNFEQIASILSEGNSNNDLGDDTIIKDMVGYFNKRKISDNIFGDNNSKNDNKDIINDNKNNKNDINNKNENNNNKKDNINKNTINSQREGHILPNILYEKNINDNKKSPNNNENEIKSNKKIGGQGTFRPNILNMLEKKNQELKNNENNPENKNNINNNINNSNSKIDTPNKNDNILSMDNTNMENPNIKTEINKKEKLYELKDKIKNISKYHSSMQPEKLKEFKLKALQKMGNNLMEIDDEPIKNAQYKYVSPSSNELTKTISLQAENENNMYHINNELGSSNVKDIEFEPKELEETNNFSLNKPNVRTNRYNSVFVPNIVSNDNKHSTSKFNDNPLIPFDIIPVQEDNKNTKTKKEKKLKIEDLNNQKEDSNNSNSESSSSSSCSSSSQSYSDSDSESEKEKENNVNNVNKEKKDSLKIKPENNVNDNNVITNNNNNNIINNTRNKNPFGQENTFRISAKSNEKNKVLKSPVNNLLPNPKIINDDKIVLSPNEKYFKNFKNNLIDEHNINRTIKSVRNTKNLKIIEQIKKEKKDNNNSPLNDEIQRRNSFNYDSNQRRNSENNISGISKNNQSFNKNNNKMINTSFKKSKSKTSFKNNKIITPKKNISTQVYINKNKMKTPTHKKNTADNLKTMPNTFNVNKTKKQKQKYIIPQNLNNNMKFIQKDNSNNKNIKSNINNNDNINKNINEFNKNEKEKEEESYNILREKFLEFLTKSYNGNIPKETKEDEILDEKLFRNLAKNEIPIENDNLDNLKCSKNMKDFLAESMKNFKLEQMKEKVHDLQDEDDEFNNQQFDLVQSNLLDLINLDYENENKGNEQILEPMELEKSNVNMSIRKSFIDSIRRYSQKNLPSVEMFEKSKKSSLFK